MATLSFYFGFSVLFFMVLYFHYHFAKRVYKKEKLYAFIFPLIFLMISLYLLVTMVTNKEDLGLVLLGYLFLFIGSIITFVSLLLSVILVIINDKKTLE